MTMNAFLNRLFHRETARCWRADKLEALIDDLRACCLERTPYPWLAGVPPLPRRTGRAHLRLVVNN